MKKAYELPDSECERLTQPEMTALRWLLNMSSQLDFARGDLNRRLACVPYGRERMNMLAGGMRSLFQDVLGTVSNKQRANLRNTARDYSVRLVPQVGLDKRALAIEANDMKELVDAARTKCKYCSENGHGARKCKLYQLLEVYVPLDDYGDDIICPYAYREWEGEHDESH